MPYHDSLQSNLFTYFGQSMNGPQYFLILKEDSTFTWDAWYGCDSYISSGTYTIESDTLFIKGNVGQTETFEVAYKNAKPKWLWYNKIYVNRKFVILAKDSASNEITSLRLIKQKKSETVDWNAAYRNMTDKFFIQENLHGLKKLLTYMEEKEIDAEIIKYAEAKILILEKKLNTTKPKLY